VQEHKADRKARTVAEGLKLHASAVAATTLAVQVEEIQAGQGADHLFGGATWMLMIMAFLAGCCVTIAIMKFKRWIEDLIVAAKGSGIVNGHLQTNKFSEEIVCEASASRPVCLYISPGGEKYHTRGDCQAMLGMTSRMADVQARTFCGHCTKREMGKD